MSSVGILYLLGYLLIVVGLVGAPWMQKRSFILIGIGSVLALAIAAIRIIVPPAGSQINIITLPYQTETRFLNRVLNEQDAVLFGAQLGPYFGLITSAEKESLDSTFGQAYEEMYAYGATPLSPFVTTYFNQQQTNAFDVVIAEPKTETAPKTGILFLHGFGGNFTVQCWLLARPGFSINALTVCPSTSVSGAWWNAQGEAIFQETMRYLRQRGVERIYVAGLSNGAIGTSRLAKKYEHEIAGLILISGADPQATMTDLPVLLIHGKSDERIPLSIMEQYASSAGENATSYFVVGDHFLLLKQGDQVQEVIVNWLDQQERNSRQ